MGGSGGLIGDGCGSQSYEVLARSGSDLLEARDLRAGAS